MNDDYTHQFSLPHLYISLGKVGRMHFWALVAKGPSVRKQKASTWCMTAYRYTHSTHARDMPCSPQAVLGQRRISGRPADNCLGNGTFFTSTAFVFLCTRVEGWKHPAIPIPCSHGGLFRKPLGPGYDSDSIWQQSSVKAGTKSPYANW